MKTFILTLCALTLTACGGGGGGDSASAPIAPTAVSLNSANQTVAAQDGASTTVTPLSGAETITGAQTSGESAVFAIARAQLDQLPAYLNGAGNALVGAVQSQTVNCPNGGSLTVSVSHAGVGSDASPGDSVTITSNGCVMPSGSVSGSLGLTINALTGTFGSSSYSASISMTYNNFGVSTSQMNATANGGIIVSLSVTGTNSFTETISSPSLTVNGTYGGVSRTRSVTNYSGTATRVPDLTYNYLTRYTFSGTVTSTGLGSQSITVATPTTFVRRYLDQYPSSGVMTITGASNSKVQVTALSNTQVKLELDADGNGVYESSTTVNWNTLL